LIVSFLVAMDRKLVIGDEKGIPWHLPADLKRFRKLTLGKPIIMGRTTFEHIGRPLDKRTNIVLSRRQGFNPEGALVAQSLDEAFRLAGDVPEVVVIGGGEVFREAFPLANRAYLTFVESEFHGTVFFPPEFPPSPKGYVWKQTHYEEHPADAKNPFPHNFRILELVVDTGWHNGATSNRY
jgi:dihydrofolate reductase